MHHVNEADPNDTVLTEDMSAVRFILAKFVLLPVMDKESIEICSEARLLLGTVGACNHLVSEIDTRKKYTDVSWILALISEMMAMCLRLIGFRLTGWLLI